MMALRWCGCDNEVFDGLNTVTVLVGRGTAVGVGVGVGGPGIVILIRNQVLEMPKLNHIYLQRKFESTPNIARHWRRRITTFKRGEHVVLVIHSSLLKIFPRPIMVWIPIHGGKLRRQNAIVCSIPIKNKIHRVSIQIDSYISSYTTCQLRIKYIKAVLPVNVKLKLAPGVTVHEQLLTDMKFVS